MQLYNTLTRRAEPFPPPHDPITMYVCGITPYDDAHLGHAMSAVIFDVLRRYLEWRGGRVRFVYNYTDIDDKMIARAARLGISVPELADRQIQASRPKCANSTSAPPTSTRAPPKRSPRCRK